MGLVLFTGKRLHEFSNFTPVGPEAYGCDSDEDILQQLFRLVCRAATR